MFYLWSPTLKATGLGDNQLSPCQVRNAMTAPPPPAMTYASGLLMSAFQRGSPCQESMLTFSSDRGLEKKQKQSFSHDLCFSFQAMGPFAELICLEQLCGWVGWRNHIWSQGL